MVTQTNKKVKSAACAIEGCHEEAIEGYPYCFEHIAESMPGECNCVLPSQSCPVCELLAAVLFDEEEDEEGYIIGDPALDGGWWGNPIGEVCR